MATMSKSAARAKRKRLKKRGKSGIVVRRPGAFTAWCKRHGYGNKVTSKCIQAGLKSKDPRVKKMANFARNSRRWKKGNRSTGHNPGPMNQTIEQIENSIVELLR